jgi:hypothetical protein
MASTSSPGWFGFGRDDEAQRTIGSDGTPLRRVPLDSPSGFLWTLCVLGKSDPSRFTPPTTGAYATSVPLCPSGFEDISMLFTKAPRGSASSIAERSLVEKLRMTYRRHAKTIEKVENVVFCLWGIGLMTMVWVLFQR